MFLWTICFVCGSLSYWFLKSVLFNENNSTKNLSQNLRSIKKSLMRKKKYIYIYIYKRDKASDIDISRGQKECPPASL